MSSVVEMQPEIKVGAPRVPRIRTAVAMFVARFPRIDEPSVLREMNELERQGQPIVLVPLLRDRSRVIHE